MAKSKRKPRISGYICHVGCSATGGFWAVLRANDPKRTVFFAYGKGFLSHPDVPRVGEQVTFVALPALLGTRLPRANEIEVLRSSRYES